MNDTEVRLPELADSVESVRLSTWLKQEGDRVEAGEPIVEVETDKTNVELEAPASGVLRAIQCAEGADGLTPGTVLALIVDEPDSPDRPPEAEAPREPGPASVAVQDIVPPSQLSDEETSGEVASAPESPSYGEGQAATPLAARMAAAAGLDLSQIETSRANGRIGKTDVERALAERRGTPQATAPPVSASKHEVVGLTAMRRVTAARMQESKQNVPHFYLRVECAANAALALVATAKREGIDPAPTLTDLVVRASAFALKRVPQANSAWADGTVRLYETVDIAIAVSTPGGLITPVVRAADQKTLGEIAKETKELVARAREGRLTPSDYMGGTFTISNLGMYGVESLYPIVNPPQSCILGVGAAVTRPVVEGTTVTVGAVMACTLSADHRVLDGAVGAQFLAAVKSYIEQPGLMMI